MEFNVDKKKVMHLGRNHLNFSYTLVGSELAELLREKKEGVIMDGSIHRRHLLSLQQQLKLID